MSGSLADVEGPLGLRRGHQVVALLVIGVERHGRVARGLVGEAPEAVDAGTQVAAAIEPIVVQSRGRRDVPDLEVASARVIGNHERGILRPEEVRAARPRHARASRNTAASRRSVPRSCAVTEPRLGWKLTNAPQPTGIRVGAPVIM